LRVVRSPVTVANPVPSAAINAMNSVRARVRNLYFLRIRVMVEKRIIIVANAGTCALAYVLRKINELPFISLHIYIYDLSCVNFH